MANTALHCAAVLTGYVSYTLFERLDEEGYSFIHKDDIPVALGFLGVEYVAPNYEDEEDDLLGLASCAPAWWRVTDHDLESVVFLDTETEDECA